MPQDRMLTTVFSEKRNTMKTNKNCMLNWDIQYLYPYNEKKFFSGTPEGSVGKWSLSTLMLVLITQLA